MNSFRGRKHGETMKRLLSTCLVMSMLACANAQAQNIDAEIDALTARVEKLEGTRAVKKLQRAFGYYVDRGLWGEAADLFADNGTIEIGLDGVYVGKARDLKTLAAHYALTRDTRLRPGVRPFTSPWES